MIQTTNKMIPRDSGLVCEVCGCEEGCLQRWEGEGGGPQYLAGIERPTRTMEVRDSSATARLQAQSRLSTTSLACPVCGCEDGCLHRWEDDGGPILVSAEPVGFPAELTHVTT